MVFAIHNAKSFSLTNFTTWTRYTWAIGVASLTLYVAFDFAALDCLDEADGDSEEEDDVTFFLLGFLGTWGAPADGMSL